MAQSFNLQSALAALQNAPPDVKQKAADMMAQYGGASPTTQEQPGWLQTPQTAPNAPPQGNPAFGNVSDILANYDAMQNPPQQQDSTLIQPPYGPEMPAPADQPSATPSAPQQYPGFSPATFGQPAASSQPKFIQPRTNAPATLADQAAAAEAKYRAAVVAPKPQTRWWQNALAISGQIAANVFNPQNQVPIRSWGQIKHDAAIKNAAATLQPLAQLQDAATQDAFKKAQADWYSGRNPVAMAGVQQRANAAEGRVTEEEKKQADITLRALFRSKVFDPNDPTHAAIAQKAGLDPSSLKGWDDRRPDMKEIAGIWYQRQGNKPFEPTNLGPDESKEMKDYTVTMPDGTDQTFRVPALKAADFATQMNVVGAKLKQQANIVNVTNQREIDEANQKALTAWQDRESKAENEWQNRNANRMIEIAKAGAAANPESQGLYQQMLAAQSRMEQTVNAQDSNGNTPEFLKAQKEFWDANKAFLDAQAKQANGQQVVKAMQAAMEGKRKPEPRPTPITFTPIQSAPVGGSTRPAVSKSKDPLGILR